MKKIIVLIIGLFAVSAYTPSRAAWYDAISSESIVHSLQNVAQKVEAHPAILVSAIVGLVALRYVIKPRDFFIEVYGDKDGDTVMVRCFKCKPVKDSSLAVVDGTVFDDKRTYSVLYSGFVSCAPIHIKSAWNDYLRQKDVFYNDRNGRVLSPVEINKHFTYTPTSFRAIESWSSAVRTITSSVVESVVLQADNLAQGLRSLGKKVYASFPSLF